MFAQLLQSLIKNWQYSIFQKKARSDASAFVFLIGTGGNATCSMEAALVDVMRAIDTIECLRVTVCL